MNNMSDTDITPPTERNNLPVTRAGDYMRAVDKLRLALELMEGAALHLERRDGSSDPLVIRLRMQLARLRATP